MSKHKWWFVLISILVCWSVTGCEAADVVEQVNRFVDELEEEGALSQTPDEDEGFDVVLTFPAERYPETALHIAEAIAGGHSDICTIDRDGSDRRRELSLANIPTKPNRDRDEWPMAICAEGGEGASVRYIDPSDNRGAGSWVGNQLREYPDGTRVKFVVPET